jgi:hypothetical protein
MIVKNTLKQCYSIAQVLAQVLANKPVIFFQTTFIIYYLLSILCQNVINIITCRIENNRINSYFFSRERERLDAIDSASTYGASTIKNNLKVKTQSKKVPCEIGVTL